MTGQTNIGATFSIAVTSDPTVPDPQNTTLSESEFSALTRQQVATMGNHGDTGTDQNLVNYPTWDQALAVQQKGNATGRTPDVEFLDVASNGMTAMKAAAAVSNTNNYATRIVWPDGQVEYNRGVITSPSYPKGENESFRRVAFMIGANQEPVFTPPS